MATKQKIHLDFWVATQLSGTITYHRPLILGHIFTSLVVNLKLLHPDYTDLTPSMNQPPGPTYFGRYGVVSQGEGSFFLTPAGLVIPLYERVFRKKVANQEATSQQPVPPIATQQAVEEAPAEAPQDHSVEACLTKIKDRMQHMEGLLQLLVNSFLPRDHPH